MRRDALSFTRVPVVAAMLVLGVTPCAWPQAGTASAPDTTRAIAFSDHVRARATVAEINHADRTVVLKGENGSTIELKVGPQAKNFDQVKIGDEVQADFYTSTVILLRKSSEPPSASSADLVQLAAPGETPGGLMVSTREITARIDAVDAAKRSISLTGPRGKATSLKIGEDVANLDQFKPGDEVVVRYSEALALAVDKD